LNYKARNAEGVICVYKLIIIFHDKLPILHTSTSKCY